MPKSNLQGALPFNEKQIQEVLDRVGYVLVARKIDGVRCELVIQEGEVIALSRSGKPLPALQAYFTGDGWQVATLRSYYPYGARLDVEVTLDGHTFQEGCGLLRTSTPAKIAKMDYSKVRLWPIADLTGQVEEALFVAGETFAHRHNYAKHTVELFCAAVGFQFGCTGTQAVTSLDQVQQLYEAHRALGFEGALVYDPDGRHRTGKVLGWWKVKPEEEADGVIIDLEEGEGRLKGTMGAAVVRLEDGTVTKVGTGWDDPTRAALWTLYVADRNDRATGSSHRPYGFWQRYIQITFMERTDDGNIRHPAFDRFRDTEDNPGVKT